MVTRSSRRPRTPAALRLVALLAIASVGCAGNGAGPRDAHDTQGTSATSAPRPHDGRATRRTLGWISLAAGAEAAIAAIVTSGMLVHEKSVLDAQCNAQKQCSPAGVDATGAIP